MISPKKFALISSTSASVARTVYSNTSRENFSLDLILTDRACGAENFALDFKIPCERIDTKEKTSKSDYFLNKLLDHKIDYVFVFYDKLFTGDMLKKFSNRLINFHPSLLPAFPGMQGFEDSINSGALIIGSTVHYIDDGIDSGTKIIQAACPVDIGNLDKTKQRHIVFSQQVASLLQVYQWLQDERIKKNAYIDKADYAMQNGFVPSLEPVAQKLFLDILNTYHG